MIFPFYYKGEVSNYLIVTEILTELKKNPILYD